jgi:hypothetical protein
MTDLGVLTRLKVPAWFLLLIALIAIIAFDPRGLDSFAQAAQSNRSQSPAQDVNRKTTAAGDSQLTRAIIIKFRQGTGVRLRDRRFVRLVDDLSPESQSEYEYSQFDPLRIAGQISTVNQIVAGSPVLDIARLFLLPEERLERERYEGEKISGRTPADLNLYYRLTMGPGQEFDSLVEQLSALDIIEQAYVEPKIILAGGINLPVATPDLMPQQQYLNPAPEGIDASYAWTLPGGRGERVKIIDIETAWNFGHEDLPPPFYRAGWRLPVLEARNHGTAALGQLIGADNGYGIRGIAHRARAGVVSWIGMGVAAAINVAAAQLDAGDVILIEVQAQGPTTSQACQCGCQQFEYIPVEYFPAEFDAISQATARGIVVIEAAGNGSVSLDHPAYQERFNRDRRDSGAIIVGAGEPSTGSPTCWTNYGSRVDLHVWGAGIVTTGYGDLEVNGRGEDQFYTSRFSGTSGASPMVAGAAAIIQGVRKARGAPPLGPLWMRNLLNQTGTPPAESEKHIGPRPDLRHALTALADR